MYMLTICNHMSPSPTPSPSPSAVNNAVTAPATDMAPGGKTTYHVQSWSAKQFLHPSEPKKELHMPTHHSSMVQQVTGPIAHIQMGSCHRAEIQKGLAPCCLGRSPVLPRPG